MQTVLNILKNKVLSKKFIKKSVKQGELAIVLTAVILASGVVIGYGVKEVLPEGTGAFFKEWIAHPEIGAFAPCSKFVAAEIVKPLRKTLEIKRAQQEKSIVRVLEVGSGPGVLTREIIKVLKESEVVYELDLVEINELFCEQLRKEFMSDPAVKVHQVDITQWHSAGGYDCIISTLPFNIFEKNTIESILDSYCSWLVPGGSVSYVELAGLPRIGKLFMSSEKKEVFEEKLQVIRNFKEKHLDKTTTILLNFFPLYVHHLVINGPELEEETIVEIVQTHTQTHTYEQNA